MSTQGHKLICGLKDGLAAELTHGADHGGLHDAYLLPCMAEAVRRHFFLVGRVGVVCFTFDYIGDKNLVGFYFYRLEHLAQKRFLGLFHGAGWVA